MSSIVGIDCETTGIFPDRRAWEVGLILPNLAGSGQVTGRENEGGPERFRWFVDVEDLDLGNADPFALQVGRFYERHPQMNPEASGLVVHEATVVRRVERLTRGQHLLGAVVNFDADVLDRRMRAHGILPSFHYHLIEVEALAVGYLWGAARANALRNAREGRPTDPADIVAPSVRTLPWNSEDLSRDCGVEPPPKEERHSALADAEWALRLHQKITGGSGG